MADKSQRTEQPTPRRIQKARQEGRFAASREFVSAVQFLAFVLALAALGGAWVAGFGRTMRRLLLEAFAG